MNELILRDVIRLSSIFALLVTHALVWFYGTDGGQRGRRSAVAYLVALDWALMMGVAAGRSVAGEGVPFWSLYTVGWGFLGGLLLSLPAWLLYQLGLRFSAIFLLPVMPTDQEQRGQAGRTLRAYAWGLNCPFHREEYGELQKSEEGRKKMGGLIAPKGGPGLVMTSSHYAVPLTAGTRDTRAGGHGLVFTGPGERPRCLVDLRPQSRSKLVHALTRDGIPVKVKVSVTAQIDRRGAEGDWLYPFDPDAVFAAIQTQGVGPEGEEEEKELGWDQIVVERAADLAQDAIARTLLDRLLESEEEGGDPPFKTLAGEVKEELATAMAPHGTEVLGVGLGTIEVEDEEVLKQRVESWRASWERRRLEREAQGEAEATRLIEEARADAQRQMIAAISEALQQLKETGTPVPAHLIALRFIDVLEDVAASQPVQELLPETAQDIPAQLRLLVEQASLAEGDEEAQKSEH
ncbi:MAG TPA: SPFH domain-containing protein [Anaerolineae bacterium]|nr:SPFH domain-containing protein [Anaerolineae bacterium]